MSNLIEDLWNGYVLQESAKVQQRLGVTQQQQQAYQVPAQPSNVQAQVERGVTVVPGGVDTRTLLIGGGVLAVIVTLWAVFKK